MGKDNKDKEIENLISVLSGESGNREDAMRTAQKIQAGLESIETEYQTADSGK